MVSSSREQSRAERRPRSRVALALGAVVVVLLGVGLVRKLSGQRVANVPAGIAGMQLGWTRAAVQQAEPRLAPGSLEGRFVVFDEPATCTLGFSAGDRLQIIDCAFDPPASPADRERSALRLLATLRQLYGAETASEVLEQSRSWSWKGAKAELTVRDAGGRLSVAERAR